MKKSLLVLLILTITLYSSDADRGMEELRNKNYSKALKYLKKSCRAQEAYGCYALGNVYSRGMGTIRGNASLSHQYFIKGCNYGNWDSCYLINVGKYDASFKDYAKAKQVFISDCKNNNGEACASIGIMYALGHGVAKDVYKAKPYIQKACRLGFEGACDVRYINF